MNYFDYGIIIKPTYNSCRLKSPIVASIQTPTLCINIGGLFLIWTHSSHHISLSLLHRKESLLYCAEKGLSLTNVKPKAAETKATTAEVKFDLRGLEDLLI